MDPIKEAFSKIKQDIFHLSNEIASLKSELTQINKSITLDRQTTDYPLSTDKQTLNGKIMPLEGLKVQNNAFSIGNEGVPTDKQTNRQSFQQTNRHENSVLSGPIPYKDDLASKTHSIIDSLGELRNHIKSKFEALTHQEINVFCTIYALEAKKTNITYKLLAEELSLTESSIRDYINRLIKKDIPVNKTRVNNKTVLLSISPELRKTLSFSSIIN